MAFTREQAEEFRKTPKKDLDPVELLLLEDNDRASTQVEMIDQRIARLEAELDTLRRLRAENVGVCDYTIGLAMKRYADRKAAKPTQ